MRLPRRRSDCPISSALDLLGDKWSLVVMRDVLLRGKTHYREFAASEERIATNILADRLSRLEAAGLLERDAGELVPRRRGAAQRRLGHAARAVLAPRAWPTRPARDTATRRARRDGMEPGFGVSMKRPMYWPLLKVRSSISSSGRPESSTG